MNQITRDIYENLELLPPDPQGWGSEHRVFSDLVATTRPEVIIEVGTWKGASAITMAKACQSEGLNTKIYCVDTWLGAVEFWTDFAHTPERNLMQKNGYPSIYYQFLSNVVHAGLQDIIIPIPNTSAIATKILKAMGVKAQLIYIDGSHDYEDVKADIRAYRELLAPGGIMFGDDFKHFADVERAVKEEVKNFEVIDNNYWIAK